MTRLKSLLLQTKALLKSRGNSLGARTFLVVDDDVGARQTICEYLRSFGYKKVLEAASGTEALKVLADNEVHFIISDWEMPETSGIDLLRQLKVNPKFRDIPFIMVTSPVSRERNKIEDAASLKVDGYIIKPFRSQILQEKIHDAIAASNIRGRRAVLLVDDDDEVRGTIREYVEKLGYGPVFEARDGDEGLLLLRQHQGEIAFVLSDWEMPKLQGIDLLRRIRSDPMLESTPFIMVTSQTSIERIKIEQALAADVDHYLLKPFRVDDLCAKIDHVLAMSKGQIGLERDLTRGEESLLLCRWDDAVLAFKGALESDPRNIRANVGLGIAHRGLGDEQSLLKAVQFFRKAITISPAAEEAHIELALTFEHGRAVDHAIEVLYDAVKSCIFSERIRYHLGRLLLLRGQQAEGMRELKKALEINPNLEEAKALLVGREEK